MNKLEWLKKNWGKTLLTLALCAVVVAGVIWAQPVYLDQGGGQIGRAVLYIKENGVEKGYITTDETSLTLAGKAVSNRRYRREMPFVVPQETKTSVTYTLVLNQKDGSKQWIIALTADGDAVLGVKLWGSAAVQPQNGQEAKALLEAFRAVQKDALESGKWVLEKKAETSSGSTESAASSAG